MNEWVKCCVANDVLPGAMLSVVANDLPVCIANVAGQFFAFADCCTHADAPLSEGELNGTTVECPMHGAHFDIVTGEAKTPPATEPVVTYPVKVEDNEIYVSV